MDFKLRKEGLSRGGPNRSEDHASTDRLTPIRKKAGGSMLRPSWLYYELLKGDREGDICGAQLASANAV